MGKACDARNPQPCALTTSATQAAENWCLRSMLVTVSGISTRTLVLRRAVLGVDISMGQTFMGVPLRHLNLLV
jgi:hypothetical protein